MTSVTSPGSSGEAWHAVVASARWRSGESACTFTSMRASIAFGCYVAGAVAFLRFFWLALSLRRERVGEPASRLYAWFPWLPGEFTARGRQLRRRMNGLLLLGWLFLVAGWVLSPR